MESLTYKEAFAELQLIVNELEKGEIEIDDLSIKVKRAGELFKLCKESLIATEGDVNQILKELDENYGE